MVENPSQFSTLRSSDIGRSVGWVSVANTARNPPATVARRVTHQPLKRVAPMVGYAAGRVG